MRVWHVTSVLLDVSSWAVHISATVPALSLGILGPLLACSVCHCKWVTQGPCRT